MRVCADVFHLPALAVSLADGAERLPRIDNCRHLFLQPAFAEANVYKAGARQFNASDRSGCAVLTSAAGREMLDNRLGDLARVGLLPGGLLYRRGDEQRDIGAVVAVLGLFGALNLYCRNIDCRQVAGGLCRGNCVNDRLLYLITNHFRFPASLACPAQPAAGTLPLAPRPRTSA